MQSNFKLKFEEIITFLKFCAINAHARVLFPRHFEGFFPLLLPFSFILTALSRKWRLKLFVRELRQIFYGHLARIQSKKSPNPWKRPNEGLTSGQKDLRRQTKECTAVFFFTNFVRNWIEKASDKSNNSTREIAKKFKFTISKFRAQWYEDIWPTVGGKPSS